MKHMSRINEYTQSWQHNTIFDSYLATFHSLHKVAFKKAQLWFIEILIARSSRADSYLADFGIISPPFLAAFL